MAQGDPATIYDFYADDIDGNSINLGELCRDKVCVIVNVATQWGLTKTNYQQLKALYGQYADAGLRILAFPCNQFGSQEPGTNQEIKKNLTENYGITFNLFAKIQVNGKDAHPLWTFLKEKQGGFLVDAIKWNFTKFLVDKNGIPIKRFGPKEDPNVMIPDIKTALGIK